MRFELRSGDGSRLSQGNHCCLRIDSGTFRMSHSVAQDGTCSSHLTIQDDHRSEDPDLANFIEKPWSRCPSAAEPDRPACCPDEGKDVIRALGSASLSVEAAEDGYLARVQYVFADEAGSDTASPASPRHDGGGGPTSRPGGGFSGRADLCRDLDDVECSEMRPAAAAGHLRPHGAEGLKRLARSSLVSPASTSGIRVAASRRCGADAAALAACLELFADLSA
jgi:hypothetical protein